jgi:hypothetical protein
MRTGDVIFLPAPSSSFKNAGNDKEEEEKEEDCGVTVGH